MKRAWTLLWLLAITLLTSSDVVAQVQRMLIPRGTTVKLVAKTSARPIAQNGVRVVAHCVDPHLAGPVGQTFKHVSPQTDALVEFADGRPSIRLAEAIERNMISIEGDYPDLIFRSNYEVDTKVVYQSDSVLASRKDQVHSLDQLHELYEGVGPITGGDEAWRVRYLHEIRRLGYERSGTEDSIKAFQADWGLEQTGSISWDTEFLLDEMLATTEACRPISPDDGKVFTVINIGDPQRGMFRLVDAETGITVRRDGRAVQTNSVEELREAIHAAPKAGRQLEYIRLIGFRADEATAFRATLKIADAYPISGSRRFFQRGAQLDTISEPLMEADGTFIVQVQYTVEARTLKTRLVSSTRATVETAASAIRRFFVRATPEEASIRAAVREARKAVREAGLRDSLTIELTDEFSGTQLVENDDRRGGEAYAAIELEDRDRVAADRRRTVPQG